METNTMREQIQEGFEVFVSDGEHARVGDSVGL